MFVSFSSGDFGHKSDATLNTPKSEKTKLIGSLKKVILDQELRKITLPVATEYGEIRMIVSAFRIDGEISGWIIALEKEDQGIDRDEPPGQ